MLPIDHNGEGFHYLVSYRRHKPIFAGPATENVRRVTDWRQSQLMVDHVETYAEYVVAVQAANSVGPAPQTTVERRIGHSGENGQYELMAVDLDIRGEGGGREAVGHGECSRDPVTNLNSDPWPNIQRIPSCDP